MLPQLSRPSCDLALNPPMRYYRMRRRSAFSRKPALSELRLLEHTGLQRRLAPANSAQQQTKFAVEQSWKHSTTADHRSAAKHRVSGSPDAAPPPRRD